MDFFKPQDGELLFSTNIFKPVLFEPKPTPPESSKIWSYYLWRNLRPLSSPSTKRQGDATALFYDVVAVGGDQVIHKPTFTPAPTASAYEKSAQFVNYLLATRPKANSTASVRTIESGSTVSIKSNSVEVMASSLSHLQEFALGVHDILLGFAVLDLFAKLPEKANIRKARAEKKDIKEQISKIRESKFAWGCLVGFLISGVQGLMFASRDNDNVTIGNAIAIISATEEIQALEGTVIKEPIWCRTHDYIMNLLEKAFLASQAGSDSLEFGSPLVEKVQLAVCMAYDIGYYWTVTVPNMECVMPLSYLGKKLRLIEGKVIEVEKDQNDANEVHE